MSIENRLFHRAVDSPAGRRKENTTIARQSLAGWGWLPVFSSVAAVGLCLVAVGYSEARYESSWADLLYWLGLITLFAPIAGRLAATGCSRTERLGLVLIAGMGLYLVKVMHSPIHFTFHDEYMHWRTVNDILRYAHLFHQNPIIPTMSLYPGLATMTASIASMSGLSVYTIAIIILGVGRVILTLSLYLLYELASGSSRVAGIAALLYMANPSLIYFDAQFAYESLAVPLAVFTLFAITYRTAKLRDQDRRGITLIILLGLSAVVVTHHLTAYVFVAFLILWTLTPVIYRIVKGLIEWLQGYRSLKWLMKKQVVDLTADVRSDSRWLIEGDNLVPSNVMLLAVVISGVWLSFAAIFTVLYLSPYLVNGIMEFFRMILLGEGGRQLFRSSLYSAPVWEQIFGYLSVMLILIGLFLGWIQIWKRSTNFLVLALGLGALAYPLSLVFRLTSWGVEAASRTSGYLFVSVAFTLSIELWSLRASRSGDQKFQWIATCLLTLIFTGGVILGFPTWARMPGPYLVSADMRTIEQQSIMAATWSKEYLGPANRYYADRVNRLLMATIGDQFPVTGFTTPVNARLMFSETLGREEKDIIKRSRIDYLLVDRRLSLGPPMAGVYFGDGESRVTDRKSSISATALAKFDSLDSIDRIFDSGDIQIYDVGKIKP